MPSNLNLELKKFDKIFSLSQIEDLLKITEEEFISPVSNLKTLLQTKISPLDDQPIDTELLGQVFSLLNQEKSIIGLNHIGFCYHVVSQENEQKRLLESFKNKNEKVYEEPSNDESKWYFVGDTKDTSKPMLELLPVESQDLTFIDYWLPHIHIDIDTKLDERQIESLLYKVYDGDPKPYMSTVIDDVIYSVRTRLGIVEGVNIFLDLSTNHRNVDYSRKNILKQIS